MPGHPAIAVCERGAIHVTRQSTCPVAPAVEVPASLMPLSLVYVFEAPRCPARCPCLSRQLSVMAEELPSACQARQQVRTVIHPASDKSACTPLI